VPRMLSKFNMAAIKPEVIFAKLLTHSLTHSINQSINQSTDRFWFLFCLLLIYYHFMVNKDSQKQYTLAGKQQFRNTVVHKT